MSQPKKWSDKRRAMFRPKTHCPSGHPLDEANTGRYKNGVRYCRICRRATTTRWKTENREAYLAHRRKHFRAKTYGLTDAEYMKMMERPCQICGGKSGAVDHCHYTGKIRGSLCDKCNGGLGFFHDSPSLLRAAAEYLEQCV